MLKDVEGRKEVTKEGCEEGGKDMKEGRKEVIKEGCAQQTLQQVQVVE